MKKTVIAAAVALTAIATTVQADDAVPQLNMSEDLVVKEMEESAAASTGTLPFIIFILLIIFAMQSSGGSDFSEALPT